MPPRTTLWNTHLAVPLVPLSELQLSNVAGAVPVGPPYSFAASAYKVGAALPWLAGRPASDKPWSINAWMPANIGADNEVPPSSTVGLAKFGVHGSAAVHRITAECWP